MMLDVFDYTSPLGFMGKLADWLFLKNFMSRLLTERDRVIKKYAESGQWRNVVRIDRMIKD